MAKILIVEDEAPLAKALELKLTKAGYETTVANDGLLALQIIQQQTFDLLVLDLMLPGINGFDLLQRVRQLNVVTPCIVTSNLSQEIDIDKAKQLGALKYFVKSNTPINDIVTFIGQALSGNVDAAPMAGTSTNSLIPAMPPVAPSTPTPVSQPSNVTTLPPLPAMNPESNIQFTNPNESAQPPANPAAA